MHIDSSVIGHSLQPTLALAFEKKKYFQDLDPCPSSCSKTIIKKERKKLPDIWNQTHDLPLQAHYPLPSNNNKINIRRKKLKPQKPIH